MTHKSTSPAHQTLAAVLATLLTLSGAVLLSTPAAASNSIGDVTYGTTDGTAVCDTTGEINPSNLDVSCNTDPQASAYIGADGTTASFGFVMAVDPRTTQNQAPLQQTAYVVAIGARGSDGTVTHVATVGVDGKRTNDTDFVYAKCFGASTNTYQKLASTAINDGSLVIAPDTGGTFRLTFDVPVSALVGCPIPTGSTLSADTPVQLYYGTSTAANLDVINKDYFRVGDSDINFGGLATIAFTGSLNLTKTSSVVSGPATPSVGQTTVYDLVVSASNPGVYPANDVRITDTLPQGITVLDATSSAGTVTRDGQQVTLSGLSIPAGGSATLTIRVSYTPSSAEVGAAKVLNPGADATATRGGDNATITATSNSVSSASVTGGRVSVTKTASSSLVAQGGEVTYTITINSSGTTAASMTQVRDTLPAGFTYVPGSTGGTLGAGEPGVSGQDVTYTGTYSVPTGESRTVTFRASAATTPGSYPNVAAASGPNFTPTSTGETAAVQVNAPPTAVTDTLQTEVDQAGTVTPLANDSDSDGQTLRVQSVTSGTNGSVTLSGSTATYTPKSGYRGTDSFTYTVCDTLNACTTGTVDVTVGAANTAPVGTADTASTDEDGPLTLDVLANDSDAEGSALTIGTVTQPTNGTVEVVDGKVRYTPSSNWNGTDTFTYTACDTGGLCSAPVTVTVSVTPVNDAPVGAADSASTAEDTATTIDVLANDRDAEGSALTIGTVTQPTNGTVEVVDGKVRYTPSSNWNGTDTFTYTACDTGGLCSAPVTVTVSVTPVNDAPVGTADSVTTAEDTATTLDVLANDRDADGDQLTIGTVTQPTNGTVEVVDGKVRYTPSSNWNGADTFTYQVCDPSSACDTVSVTVTVTAANDAPVGTADTAQVGEDGFVRIDVLQNDQDQDGEVLRIGEVTSGENGVVRVVDGEVVYTPHRNYHGTDTFTYTACDGTGCTEPIIVTVTVTPANDAPAAAAHEVSTPEDTSVRIDLLEGAVDVDGDTLSAQVLTQPLSGTLSREGDGTYTYTPSRNWDGTDTFTYQVCDPDGACDTATVTVRVTPVNDAPTGQPDTASTPEDTSVTLDVLADDTDVDGDPVRIGTVTQPTNGTVEIVDGQVRYTPSRDHTGTETFTYTVCDETLCSEPVNVTVTVGPVNDAPVGTADSATTPEDTATVLDVLTNDQDPDGDTLRLGDVVQPEHGTVSVVDGKLRYTPRTDWHGTETFEYEVCDATDCDLVTVTVTVTPVNDAPTARPDAADVTDGGPVRVSPLENDADNDGDELTLESHTQGENGTVVRDGDVLVYTPNPGFTGTDTFTYTVCDPEEACTTTTVTVTVDAPNRAPVAGDDAVTVAEDTAVTVDVLANDQDVDGDALTVTEVTQGSDGTVTLVDGVVTYTPNPDWNGTDTFTYTVCDPDGVCDTATVTVTVTPTNDAPVATDDNATTKIETSVEIDVLGNDRDPDGDTLRIEITTEAGNGTVEAAGGKVTYTPRAGHAGTDTFTYRICDEAGACSEVATVTVDVQAAAVEPTPVPTEPEPTPAPVVTPTPTEPEPTPAPVVTPAPVTTPGSGTEAETPSPGSGPVQVIRKLPRTGAGIAALTLAGLTLLVAGGALRRNGRRED